MINFIWRIVFFKFLSVNFISANLGAVFDLEIPSWLLLDTKRNTFFFPFCFSLSCEKGFGNGLEGLPVQSVQEIFFFRCKLIFCSCLFVSLLLFKKFLERTYLLSIWMFDKLEFLFYIHMLPLTLFFIYRHQYSFSSGKNGYSVKDSFSLQRGMFIAKINNCYCQVFP